MNHDELVEAIIREVKKVLTQRGIEVGSPPGKAPAQAKAQAPASRPSPPVPAIGSRETAAVGSTDLTGKQVITQKDLEAYRGQTITVTKKAVMTPLALDYARDKNITVSRVTVSPEKKTEGTSLSPASITAALTVSPDFTGDGSILRGILESKRLTVKVFSGGSYEENVKKLAGAVASGSTQFGICLENTGMAGPIHANRNNAIRAVHCRETFDARAARVDIGANVIVLDSVSNPEAVISGFTGI